MRAGQVIWRTLRDVFGYGLGDTRSDGGAMQPTTEFAFLAELRFLCDAALLRGERIEELSEEWTARARQVRRTMKVPPGEKSPEQRAAEQQFRARAFAEQVPRQAEFVTELDAFLNLYGRTSLLLFPQNEGNNDRRRDRAETLRAVLGIGPDHLFSDRLLRNKWIHFDEILDKLDDEEGERPTPIRFTMSDEFDPAHRDAAIRLFVLDRLDLHFRGIGYFDLRAMIDTFWDLEPRVQEALDTWADRH